MTDKFNYDLQQVVERLKVLDTVVSFLFEEIPVTIDGETVMRKRDILTDGEKICLNQERGALREFRDYLFGRMEIQYVRFYQVSPQIEKKIEQCLTIIQNTGWTKKINEININE